MKRTIILSFLLIILISSCNLGPTSSSGGVSGSDGITMSFVKDNPRDYIRSNNIKAVVEYYNKGTHSPNQLIFYLHGYDPNIMFGQSGSSFTSPPIEEKSLHNPEGSQAYFAEWTSSINSPPGNDPYPQLLTVTACYDYKTVAEASICISPDDYGTYESGKCSEGVQGLSSSQGAPVAVSSIKSIVDEDTITLEITVQNKGKGVPFYDAPVSGCYNIDINDKNTIRASVSMTDGAFSCKAQDLYGRIRMDSSGKRTFVCEKANNIRSYTLTPLRIELNYNYAESIQKQITIER